VPHVSDHHVHHNVKPSWYSTTHESSLFLLFMIALFWNSKHGQNAK